MKPKKNAARVENKGEEKGHEHHCEERNSTGDLTLQRSICMGGTIYEEDEKEQRRRGSSAKPIKR